MAAENESPARGPPAAPTRGRGRGRGGRGRGRGGGRGASNIGVTKTTATRGGRGGTRRGRAKNFTDSRVQAAYERQRDLKATYQAVAHALKPALQELAERSVDDLLQNPDKYKDTSEYVSVVEELRSNLDKKLAEHDERLECDLKLAKSTFHAEQYVIEQEFQVRWPYTCTPQPWPSTDFSGRMEFKIFLRPFMKARKIVFVFSLPCKQEVFLLM